MAIRANPGRLVAYQAAAELSADVVRLARTFRGPGSFERGDQIVRAALSVTSNIAEACGRGSVKEFRQFVLYARGSAQEVRSQLQAARMCDPDRERHIRELEHRATLVIKLLTRLHEKPPPEQ
jgi:four helix bundle protein